jgi:hypothetical protein
MSDDQRAGIVRARVQSEDDGGQKGTNLTPTGIRAPISVSGIAVRNGSITNFGTAVDLSLGHASIVEEVRAYSNNAGILIGDGIVRANTVFGAYFNSGIGTGAAATVIDNYVNTSTMHADGVDIGQGSTVIGNTVVHAPYVGIGVVCPSNVIGNTATGSLFGQNLVLDGNGCNSQSNVAP